MPELSDKLLIPIGAIIAALIAGFISFAGIMIAKDNKITEFRQDWINTTRNEISKFISLALNIWTQKNLIDSTQATESREKSIDRLSKVTETSTKELLHCQHMILLLLNPQKHIDLINSIKSISNECRYSESSSTGVLNKFIETLSTQSQVHLKSEWERVKSGEKIYRNFKKLGLFIFLATFLTVLYLSFSYTTRPSHPITFTPSKTEKTTPQKFNKNIPTSAIENKTIN